MIKKVKDLTVAQLVEYCTSQESCDDCCSFGHFCYCTLNTPYSLEEKTLEQEIEIPENANDIEVEDIYKCIEVGDVYKCTEE